MVSSHPSWVRGLKPACRDAVGQNGLSHPSWVRGLKLRPRPEQSPRCQSHPSWVRGLKHSLAIKLALIEGRTPRGCVD